MKMQPIGLILFRTIKYAFFAVVLFCAYQYADDKVFLYSLKYERVQRLCSGHHTMSSVCDCYNYYGRQCLSSEYLQLFGDPIEGENSTSSTDFDEELWEESYEWLDEAYLPARNFRSFSASSDERLDLRIPFFSLPSPRWISMPEPLSSPGCISSSSTLAAAFLRRFATISSKKPINTPLSFSTIAIVPKQTNKKESL